jgi:N utilization substance protein B
MPSRHRSRQRALQILFLWDARRQPETVDGYPVAKAIDAYYDTLFPEEEPERDLFAVQLVNGAVDHLPELDELITKRAEHWRMERMPNVDRNILRLAAYEMAHGGTPAAVAIDEALELARKYSSEESVQFVNGVLDAIHRGLAGPEAVAPETAAPEAVAPEAEPPEA